MVALLSITTGVHRTAGSLMHVGRADFALYQGEVSDFSRSLLPETLAASVAKQPGVAQVASVKLLIDHGTLVFGLDPAQFAFRRLVVVRGVRGPVMAGDYSGKHVGQVVHVAGRPFTIGGIYHSGDHFEDLGLALPLHTVETLATRPGEVTFIGIAATLGSNVKAVAAHLQSHFPGTAAITEPGQAVKVDTSSRLIVSILALIVGGIGVTNTMAMSVTERTREIGILRAVGWPAARVGRMIVSEAIGICLIALAIGCGLGILAAHEFIGRTSLSGLISPAFTGGTFLWGLAFALGVGLVGALYPMWRALRLTPVEALRHE